mgnify:CR=1 FL=1
MSKIGFSIEYPCKCASVSVLWNSIGTAPGLSEWFADDVSASGENYCFVWEKIRRCLGLKEKVMLILTKQ